MRRTAIFALVGAVVLAALVVVTLVPRDLAQSGSKGKAASKKIPLQTYVFTGTVTQVGEDFVTVDVKEANKAGRSFVDKQESKQVKFVVAKGTKRTKGTKIELNDAEANLADLAAWDTAVVQAKEPKGATSFTARVIEAQSPEPVSYFQDADGDGLGAGEAAQYAPNRVPDGYVDVGGDNCPEVANADQADSDGDGTGDACDAPTEGAAPSVEVTSQ